MAASAALVVSTVAAHAVEVPLRFETVSPIYDERGVLLKGANANVAIFGFPVETGDLVQIIQIPTNAVVLAPTTNGGLQAGQTLIAQTRIGEGIEPSLGPVGKASGSLPALQRGGGQKTLLIARVFNSPSLDDASFYQDSQIYDVPVFGATNYGVFFANVAQTTKELDTTDHDGDGLSRSWEMSYGADPNKPDTDEDGIIDGHEIRAGTDVLDPDSLLQVVQLFPLPPSDLLVQWDSIPGKHYQLEFAAFVQTNSADYASVNSVIFATNDVTGTTVTNGLLNPTGVYRARLVE